MAQGIQRFKIVLIGDGGVGKSAFIARHSGIEIFDPAYNATLGVDVHPIVINTSYGPIVFDMWDVAGQEKFAGMADGYYINAKAAIVMFDVGSLTTRKNMAKWIDMYVKVVPDTPIFVCGTKVDIVKARAVSTTSISHSLARMGIDSAYCEISSKTNYNCRAPLLWLARKLLGHEDLEFV